MSGEHRSETRATVWLAIAVEGGLIGVAWVAGWLLDQPPLHRGNFRFDLVDVLWGLAATLPMLALFFLCLRRPVGPLRTIQKFCDDVLRPLLAPCTLLDLAGISVLAGLGEEMLFRGVFQSAFERYTGSALLGLTLASVV